MAYSPMIVLSLGGGHAATVHVQEENSQTSPHTGRPLREFRGEVRGTREGDSEVISAALAGQGDDGLWSVESPGSPRTRWKVRMNSSTHGSGRYQYQLTLSEAEDLNLEALVIDGQELHP
jgi:hypothetical protein